MAVLGIVNDVDENFLSHKSLANIISGTKQSQQCYIR